MTGAHRRRLGASLVLGVLLLAGRAAAATPEAQLAQRYAPVVRLVTSVYGCEDGDPYVPTDVNVLFGNDEVVLRGPWDRVNVVKVAPTADDLASGLVDYHLDFPGDALNPGCTYADWSRRLNAKAPPTVYAHVATDAAHPGKLALQYWFFYVFNDFNNLHEGDWEMIQLDFDAATPAQALGQQPTEVGYSQHEGAERARWDDAKLEKVDGTHPVVYPAAGSHANFYSQALFLGRSAAQGVGCDDTEGPYEQLRPTVAVVPSATAAYLAEYPWLGFRGRWGELRPAFFNGPTGPNMKFQWTEPIAWSKTWRSRSFAVPGGASIGPRATEFFCGAVAAGSGVLTQIVRNPFPGALTVAAVFALLLLAASRTSWRGSAPLRLARRRAWGELITSARQMYRRRFRLFAGIGLLFIPFGIAVGLLQYLLFRVVAFVPLVQAAGETNVSVAGLAFSLGLIFTVVALAFVQAATAYAMAAVDRGEHVTALGAYKHALGKLATLFGWVVFAAVVVVVLDLTVVGIPVAAWLIVRWSLLAQVVVLDDRTSPGPLRRSAALVRGHWWRVALFTVVVTGLGLLLGPVVGGVLLLATSAAFNVINLITALVYTVTMPFVAIATTYLYYDLNTRSVLDAHQVDAGDLLPAEI
ncbi:MAG: hypothetical protein ACHQDE_04115 [Acidimicrobiia bacterium]